MILRFCLASILVISSLTSIAQNDQHRPKIHFTPEKGWMNDPNGMVFYKGIYHLFYQHYPDSTVWGPMHWGHATSTDLIRWERKPIAIFPDTLGMIFSGSAVVDKRNSSGFGSATNPPLVAIFTSHSAEAEKSGSNSFENQSLAFSTDDGKTWRKFAGNPVLRSPGIRDFRDPKVMWHEPSSKWIMALAVVDKIEFYSSPDLKNWTRESEYGKNAGAHGGVWECPDLFSLKDENGKNVWVLIVNINPGGPNKGSATQYFLGDFDGKNFKAYADSTKWIDYGPDEYAGITWSNTGDRKIFIGWMSNWDYAQVVPTLRWRSAATIARELKLKKTGSELYITSTPVDEIEKYTSTAEVHTLKPGGMDKMSLPCRIKTTISAESDFSLLFGNESGESVVIGYDKTANQFYIDRTKSGKSNFNAGFAAKHTVPRFGNSSMINLDVILDVSSIELFADEGLSTMTSIFFPTKDYNRIYLPQANPSTMIHYFKLKPVF
ncbi:glycoside hydrolase family 32 protein [Pollutibacter soli]|uniref:glycoside hydrolase family 32 protein n=1 Tax=Pollutibacter soli TaxID=3034157 RepID=UPI003013C7CA